MHTLINQMLLMAALLTIGVVYGTDVFHALVVKKAADLSSDQAIADLIGHTHLIADKRMPFVGIAGIISSLLLTVLNFNASLAVYSAITLFALLAHLAIYFRVAKPVNIQMSEAAVAKKKPAAIRALQLRWDSVIIYRALLLTVGMASLIAGMLATGGCAIAG